MLPINKPVTFAQTQHNHSLKVVVFYHKIKTTGLISGENQ